MDPDSTLALLNGDLPSVPNQNEEDSEDEIFFGDRTDKELNGKGAKSVSWLWDLSDITSL